MMGEISSINLSDLEETKLETSVERKKRPFTSEDEAEVISIKEPWVEGKTKRLKKFRVEWMNEEYFKDWLQPHPSDETYCICIACDIKLRCGKSELEKHASGLKHSKRMEAMRENPNFKPNTSCSYMNNTLSQTGDRVLSEENGTFFITTSNEQEERMGTEGLSNFDHPSGLSDTKLAQVLLKLSELMDSNSDIARKKLEMAEAEHQCRMQILNKELQLKTLEVQIKQAELQKLNSEQQGKVIVFKKTIGKQQSDVS